MGYGGEVVIADKGGRGVLIDKLLFWLICFERMDVVCVLVLRVL